MTTGVLRPAATPSRRAVLSALIGTAGIAALPATALADTEAEQIAAWFFERYLLQSISVVRFNVSQVSEEAGKVVEQEAPSLHRFLTKHRPAFTAALVPLIGREIPTAEMATVAREVTSDGSMISPATRVRLVAIDEEFQKGEQRLLRALSYELGVLVEQIVANIRKTP